MSVETGEPSLNSEHAPLLNNNNEQKNGIDSLEAVGQASFGETVVNLMKTCMGTGFLALPFACKQAGWICNCVGLLLVALWNAACVQRLCDCLNHIPKKASDEENIESADARSSADEKIVSYWCCVGTDCKGNSRRGAPEGTSTFGVVAWYSFGRFGLEMADAMLFILLLGILIAFVSAGVDFLGDTNLTLGRVADAILTGSIMVCLSMAPDVGHLSRASAVGLLILMATFFVLAGYGTSVALSSPDKNFRLPLWPASLSGICQWFGVVVFGYGLAPLTYHFRESMAQPERMVHATMLALMVVVVLYSFIGVGLLAAYPGLTGDVLHELPEKGILPALTRVAMVGVVIVTTPLLIIPSSQLVQSKLPPSLLWVGHQGRQLSPWILISWPEAVIRVGVVSTAAFIALCFPGFVQVLSLVGCACVATVSFILPPVFHFKLERRRYENWWSRGGAWLDLILLAWGVTATIISTVLTFRKVIE